MCKTNKQTCCHLLLVSKALVAKVDIVFQGEGELSVSKCGLVRAAVGQPLVESAIWKQSFAVLYVKEKGV